MLIVISLLLSIYLGWILAMIYLNRNFYKKIRTEQSKNQKISIVVAVRNEEDNLPHLINSFDAIDYPEKCLEVIFVDDDSADESLTFLRSECDKRTNYRVISSIEKGKKKALKLGIKKANYKLIVCTDADCIVPVSWLKKIDQNFNEDHHLMILPVELRAKNLFGKLQQLEFCLLMELTSASWQYGNPIMCNGANIVYRRESWEKLNLENTEHLASGDDVFALNEMKKEFPEGITCLFEKEVMVRTNAVEGIKDFIQQRRRWSSKSVKNPNQLNRFIALLVVTVNLLSIVAIIALFSNSFQKLAGIFLLGKLGVDALAIYTSSFVNKKPSVGLFLTSSLWVISYSLLLVLTSLFFKLNWKDRKI